MNEEKILPPSKPLQAKTFPLVLVLFLLPWTLQAQPPPPPVHLTAAQDHQRLMDLLHITSLRHGADSHPGTPYAVNYDESKANPYPNLPDPLILNNGKKVTSAKMWWKQRRPEIVESFDREVYGRVPPHTPKVDWKIISTTKEQVGDFPVVIKQLIGQVDNSSYPLIAVNIELSLTTPANAIGPVPIVMEFSFEKYPGFKMARPPAPALA
jgi:hypothetical protein